MSFSYSEEIMDHYMNPRNIGTIDEPDAYVEVGNPLCGDMLSMYLKVGEKDGKKIIEDLKFLSFGCAANVATASMLSCEVIGMSLDEAKNFSFDEISSDLGGVPEEKTTCSVLAVDGLKKVIAKYEENLLKKDK